jgi:hypothetical protein
MTYCNLIYIALLTQRIPIIPDFPPGHQGRKSGWVPFGKVFDTHRLAASLHIPILEWRDLKNESLPTEDHQYLWDTQNDYKHEVLGCWSLWSTHGHDHGRPRESSLTLLYHLGSIFSSPLSELSIAEETCQISPTPRSRNPLNRTRGKGISTYRP